MRRLLVQRFESSKKAFEISLEHMISTSQNILSWIDKRNKAPIFKKGFLPDIEDFYKHYKQYESFGDEIFGEEIAEVAFDEEVKKFEAKGLFEVDIKYIEDSFVEDIQADIKILEQIQQTWFGEGKNLPDPKKEHFAEILLRQIKSDPIRKIVVFSSYADTIDDLYEALKDKVKVIKYTSRESKKRRKTIELNFDAGKKAATQKDDFDVLLATDAISEGYNLHRAGTIFNYDIPYNPTRVIQRVGRINRINKKVFDRLYIYNYFPTSIGEGETRTKEIATLKMAMINAIIGEDTKVLTSDIELKSFFAEQYRSMLKGNEAESWETKYRNILNAAKDSPEYKTAQRIPHRSKVGRKTDTLKMAMINAIIGEDTKVLTGDIELKSFFAEQYKSMAKGNEAESWETKYRNILNTAKDSPEYKTAQRIPHRSKVGRKTDKDSKGVLLFGRKKDVCIFKMSDNVSDAKIILPEKAIALLEASLFECPYTVSDSFDAIYQNIKQSLFSASYSGKIDKIRRDVLDKINAIAQMNILPAEYMTSLQKAVELGALSGLDMKYIRKLKPKEFASLPGTIEQSFLDRINKMAREVDEGKECVILSEEFQ
jgi:superfamily II DNA/RNA helicase